MGAKWLKGEIRERIGLFVLWKQKEGDNWGRRESRRVGQVIVGIWGWIKTKHIDVHA